MLLEKKEQLLRLQDELNTELCNEYKHGICKRTGKKINFELCIQAEVGELIESTNYKHWKDGKDDIENVHIEIVDLLHFVLSSELVNPCSGECVITTKELDELLALLIFDRRINTRLTVIKLLCDMYKLDTNMLLRIYYGKYALNKLRKNYGYADGEYIKMWGGVEDNTYIATVIEIHKDIGNIYNALEEIYKDVIS